MAAGLGSQEKATQMPLTAKAVEHAKSRAKDYKLADERGLRLVVTRAGGKHWKLRYRFAGKQKKLSLGSFPDVLLADARERRDAARRQIALGIDPAAQRAQLEEQEQARKEETFAFVADEWLARIELEGRAEATMAKMRWIVDFARPPAGRQGDGRHHRARPSSCSQDDRSAREI